MCALIFAEIEYEEEYWFMHEGLVSILEQSFCQIDCGLETDSWIWISHGGEKVAIDSFMSMRHQVQSASSGVHIQAVLEVLHRRFQLTIFDPLIPEGHE